MPTLVLLALLLLVLMLPLTLNSRVLLAASFPLLMPPQMTWLLLSPQLALSSPMVRLLAVSFLVLLSLLVLSSQMTWLLLAVSFLVPLFLLVLGSQMTWLLLAVSLLVLLSLLVSSSQMSWLLLAVSFLALLLPPRLTWLLLSPQLTLNSPMTRLLAVPFLVLLSLPVLSSQVTAVAALLPSPFPFPFSLLLSPFLAPWVSSVNISSKYLSCTPARSSHLFLVPIGPHIFIRIRAHSHVSCPESDLMACCSPQVRLTCPVFSVALPFFCFPTGSSFSVLWSQFSLPGLTLFSFSYPAAVAFYC
ncbi:MAG TPA: hypothetical protein V6C97_01435 [Oculatellaceae cyanobacterium]